MTFRAVINLEIRELVKLKKGVGGLEPPLNIGILLDRSKDGKDHLGVVYTLRGELRVKWKYLRETGGRLYQGDKRDENSMKSFLRKAVEDERSGLLLKMDPEEILEKVSAKDLWKSVIKSIKNIEGAIPSKVPSFCIGVCLTPEMVGKVHFPDKILEPRQISAILKVLSSANDPAEPYFHRVDEPGCRGHLPYRNETLSEMRDHIKSLEDLRNVFVNVIEEETEDGRSIRRTISRLEDPRDAILDETQKEEMERICTWAMDHLENGGWTGSAKDIFGLGGTPCTRLDGFDLEKFVSELSYHITDSGGKDLPSNLVGMLLRFDRISWRRASELVVNFNLGSGQRKFHRNFPDHVMNQASRIGGTVSTEELEGRLDLRELETYTIDPHDAKDFDDAVSISRKDDQNWEVWIHIADVSHYVTPGSLIDDEARYRGTSVYLPTGVIPMLPHQLSEDMCSLREKRDRLAISTRLLISPSAEVEEVQHFKSVIRVDENLSYDIVNDFIRERREPFATLKSLSDCLKKHIPRLSLNTPERRIRFLDENSIDITLKRQTEAMELIEQLMVITNEAAARAISQNDLTVPYRVHPLPDRISVEKFNSTSESLGLNIELKLPGPEPSDETGDSPAANEESMMEALLSGGKITFGAMSVEDNLPAEKDEPNENEVAKEVPLERIRDTVDQYNDALGKMEEIEESDIRDLLKIRMLRTMPRAFYTENNIGHFGLGSGCYCHFTSPIRRYPDVLAHRAIVSIIERESGNSSIHEPPSIEEVSGMMDHVNEMSEEAEDWEREMIDVALATRALMDDEFRNRNHSVIIRSITPSTVYSLLDDGVSEGSVPIRSLSRLRLHVNEEETSISASLEGNEGVDPEDPLMARLIQNEGEDIRILSIGDRKTAALHSISVARGRIGISFSDPANG
jgi:exoribonuclease R